MKPANLTGGAGELLS